VRVDTEVMEDIARRTKLRYGLDPQQQGDLEASFGREADYWAKQGVIQQRPDISALFDTRFNAAMQAASRQAIERQQAQGNRQTAN
jgi:ABC-type nitrate/sulfonate/bicarbonate transport system substrate-binding protein